MDISSFSLNYFKLSIKRMEFSQLYFDNECNPILLLSKLGEGANGAVYLGLYQQLQCAVKLLLPQRESQEKYNTSKQYLYTESFVLERLSHKNIVTLLRPASKGLVIDSNGTFFTTHFLVLDLLKDGDMLSLSQANPLSENHLRFYVSQIIDSLIYLHEQGIVHCDIKPDNIGLTCDYSTVKLIDFGFATPLANTPGIELRGTPE